MSIYLFVSLSVLPMNSFTVTLPISSSLPLPPLSIYLYLSINLSISVSRDSFNQPSYTKKIIYSNDRGSISKKLTFHILLSQIEINRSVSGSSEKNGNAIRYPFVPFSKQKIDVVLFFAFIVII